MIKSRRRHEQKDERMEIAILTHLHTHTTYKMELRFSVDFKETSIKRNMIFHSFFPYFLNFSHSRCNSRCKFTYSGILLFEFILFHLPWKMSFSSLFGCVKYVPFFSNLFFRVKERERKSWKGTETCADEIIILICVRCLTFKLIQADWLGTTYMLSENVKEIESENWTTAQIIIFARVCELSFIVLIKWSCDEKWKRKNIPTKSPGSFFHPARYSSERKWNVT